MYKPDNHLRPSDIKCQDDFMNLVYFYIKNTYNDTLTLQDRINGTIEQYPELGKLFNSDYGKPRNKSTDKIIKTIMNRLKENN